MKKILGNILPALLAFLPYICIAAVYINGMISKNLSETIGSLLNAATIVFYVAVVFANIIYAIIWTCMGIESQRILFWNMFMKLCYIPIFCLTFIFIVGGLFTLVMGGIAIILMVFIVDVILFLPTSIYGLCGCIQAAREKNVSVGMSVVMSIMHFILCLDVVAAIVMYVTVKSSNKKRRNTLNTAYANYY